MDNRTLQRIRILREAADHLEREPEGPITAQLRARLAVEHAFPGLLEQRLHNELRDLAWRMTRIEETMLEAAQISRCALADPEQWPGVTRYMAGIGPDERTSAVAHLRNNAQQAKKMTICDPYLLVVTARPSVSEYLADLDTVVPPSVNELAIFVKGGKRNAAIADGLNTLCRKRSIALTCTKTDQLHDRVWIYDDARAYAIGASFNGFGNKCAFVLELPTADRIQFLAHLADIRAKTRNRSTV